MGKSEKGAVFVDAGLTSPFDFYQYWLNDDDELVLDHLRWLTLLERDEILDIAAAHRARPEARIGQRALAADLTARIHGEAEARNQATLAEAAFSADVSDPDILEALHAAIGGFDVGTEAESWSVLDVAVAAGAGSRGDARRLIGQGGLSVNGTRVTDPGAAPPPLIAGRYWWVALGRRRRSVGRRVSSSSEPCDTGSPAD
jgi:tyrosyl-tRNA synthetase